MAPELPSLSPPCGKNGRLSILYTLDVSPEGVRFFHPFTTDVISKNRGQMEMDPNQIALDTLEKGKIYFVAGITVNFLGQITQPSEQSHRMYTDRNAFVCGRMVVYSGVIIPALLLGCRVRDYEQRCAMVQGVDDLVLTMTMLPQSVRIDNQPLKLQTISGHTFVVVVKEVKREGRRWKVTCEKAAVPLPSDVKEGCQLSIEEGVPNQSPVTHAVFQFSNAVPLKGSGFLLNSIYGKHGNRMHPGAAPYRSPILLKDGGEFLLNDGQLDAVAHYNSAGCKAFIIEAPPGSGKTMTAAAMAASYKGKGVQLFLSTANVPVKNMALALDKLNFGDRSPIHLTSSEFELKFTDQTHSPFSALSLAKNQQELKEKIEELKTAFDEAPDEEKGNIQNKIYETCWPVLNEPHDIYFATVDTILNRLFKQNKGGSLRTDTVKNILEKEVVKIVIDEASQLTEAALNAILLCFPDAQIVLIGDSKQLPPFKYEKGKVDRELAARPALDVVQDKNNIPVINLLTVYRASPSLIAHYSDVFYGGALISEKRETNSNPLACFGDKAGDRRCLFWKVHGNYEQEGTSKINREEIFALQGIINILTNEGGIDMRDIMVISYYEAQRKLAVEQLPEGYEVLTVDSAQGREKKIVIVLTTRTAVPAETEEDDFFNMAQRCNVAVSRHQEGLIVIGHQCLASVPNWADVLKEQYFAHVEDDTPRDDGWE